MPENENGKLYIQLITNILMNNKWFKAMIYRFSCWIQYNLFGAVVAPYSPPSSSNKIVLLLLTALLLSLSIFIALNSLLSLPSMKNFLIFHSCLCRMYFSLHFLSLHRFHPHHHFRWFLCLFVWSREQKRGGRLPMVTVPTTG